MKSHCVFFRLVFWRVLVIGNHCGDKHVRSDQKNLFNRKTIVVIIFKIVIIFCIFNFIVGNNFVFLIFLRYACSKY